jgi:hypothetical protein
MYISDLCRKKQTTKTIQHEIQRGEAEKTRKRDKNLTVERGDELWIRKPASRRNVIRLVLRIAGREDFPSGK